MITVWYLFRTGKNRDGENYICQLFILPQPKVTVVVVLQLKVSERIKAVKKIINVLFQRWYKKNMFFFTLYCTFSLLLESRCWIGAFNFELTVNTLRMLERNPLVFPFGRAALYQQWSYWLAGCQVCGTTCQFSSHVVGNFSFQHH